MQMLLGGVFTADSTFMKMTTSELGPQASSTTIAADGAPHPITPTSVSFPNPSRTDVQELQQPQHHKFSDMTHPDDVRVVTKSPVEAAPANLFIEPATKPTFNNNNNNNENNNITSVLNRSSDISSGFTVSSQDFTFDSVMDDDEAGPADFFESGGEESGSATPIDNGSGDPFSGAKKQGRKKRKASAEEPFESAIKFLTMCIDASPNREATTVMTSQKVWRTKYGAQQVWTRMMQFLINNKYIERSGLRVAATIRHPFTNLGDIRNDLITKLKQLRSQRDAASSSSETSPSTPTATTSSLKKRKQAPSPLPVPSPSPFSFEASPSTGGATPSISSSSRDAAFSEEVHQPTRDHVAADTKRETRSRSALDAADAAAAALFSLISAPATEPGLEDIPRRRSSTSSFTGAPQDESYKKRKQSQFWNYEGEDGEHEGKTRHTYKQQKSHLHRSYSSSSTNVDDLLFINHGSSNNNSYNQLSNQDWDSDILINNPRNCVFNVYTKDSRPKQQPQQQQQQQQLKATAAVSTEVAQSEEQPAPPAQAMRPPPAQASQQQLQPPTSL